MPAPPGHRDEPRRLSRPAPPRFRALVAATLIAAGAAAPADAATSCATATRHLFKAYVTAYNAKDIGRIDREIIAREPAFRSFTGPARVFGEERGTLRDYLAERRRQDVRIKATYFRVLDRGPYPHSRSFAFVLARRNLRQSGRGSVSCRDRRIIAMALF